MSENKERPFRIAVTGATGFIGERLIETISKKMPHQIIALSRSGSGLNRHNVIGINADFFSLDDSQQALENCDIGIYLLHSMSPSNRLSQGSFEDFDFILSDNFARSAKRSGLKQIIYIGGMVDETKNDLSRHLSSRLEVEQTLTAYGTPLTTLRCSLVIGAKGSSFIILKKLVHRLPSMLLPSWVRTRCQPIYIDDLITIIIKSLGNPRAYDRIFDCGHPDPICYRTLIEYTTKALGVKRKLIDIPYIPLGLSKIWVRLVSGASRSLVYPLIDSLNMKMVADESRKLDHSIEPVFTPIDEAVKLALHQKLDKPKQLTRKPSARVRELSEVKSVQRLKLPDGYNAQMVARMYFKWLPRFFTHVIRVKNVNHCSNFYFLFFSKPMLSLSLVPASSGNDPQVFLISGGVLSLPGGKGRLEFRQNPNFPYVFAAIHDYRPSLPWWVYRLTQAVVHRYVMWSFGRFLVRVDNRKKQRGK